VGLRGTGVLMEDDMMEFLDADQLAG
jgi:hypothetical protein